MKLLLVALRSTIGFESTNLPFWAPVQIAPIDYCDQAIWGSLGTTTAVGAFINTGNYFLLIIHTVSFDRSHLTTCNWWLEAMTQSIYFQLHFWNINLEATEAWKYDSNVTRRWKKRKVSTISEMSIWSVQASWPDGLLNLPSKTSKNSRTRNYKILSHRLLWSGHL